MKAPNKGRILRCRVCGFEREWFHGWSFTIDRGRCSGKVTGTEAMLHDWELLP